MAGLRFCSKRFGFSFELYQDVALVSLGEIEETWSTRDLASSGDPQIISDAKFEALVFGRRMVLATSEAIWVVHGDFPIWGAASANGSILVVEELGLRTFSYEGAELASAMPGDIPNNWSVAPEGLRYEDFDGNTSLWSLPDLKLLKR
ncbi:hypothetical protein AWH62_09485 [Maricaulis sp. W15]|uniref:hypothetical protein n=1 Tax=Maricaulis sp. W15 TaxID=1772333 RepID=UPI000948B0FD|nr:hypothetical protein [Maricaulis sp. W15]OLF73163.1 hypothetical protein AWH62_09485 [Maricaulis sp. W15]